MNELWNEWQNSSAAFYITDGYLNFNCLEILPVMSRPASVRIDHIGFMSSKQDCEKKLAALDKPSSWNIVLKMVATKIGVLRIRRAISSR
jgi:hypothetical protein